MKPVRSLFAALCCSLPLCVAHAETWVGDDLTIDAGTVIETGGKKTDTLIQVADGGKLVVEAGLVAENLATDGDGGLIRLGEGAEAEIHGSASILNAQATGLGGVVYMAEESKLTLITENAGEYIRMQGLESVTTLGSNGKGDSNDIYMADGAVLVVNTAADSVVVLEGGLETPGDEQTTLTKLGAGTLQVGDLGFFDGGDIVVKEGNLLFLQDSAVVRSLSVQSDAAITFNLRGSSVEALENTFSITLDGAMNFVYCDQWEDESKKGMAVLTLSAQSISVGETASISLTLTKDALDKIADGGAIETWLVDTSNMTADVAEAVQFLLAQMTVLNEDGEVVRAAAVTADITGRVVITPEPATATLSLLALSALCLRRRRA